MILPSPLITQNLFESSTSFVQAVKQHMLESPCVFPGDLKSGIDFLQGRAFPARTESHANDLPVLVAHI